MKKMLVALVVVCLSAFGAAAESGFLDFSSAQILAGASGSASLDSPQAVLLNPAVSAGEQRVVVDLSVIPLFGLGPDAGDQGLGGVINFGLTIPTRAGVFSTSGRFANAGFDSLDWGTMGALNISFAKDLYPKLWIGAGLGGQVGGGAGTVDWGLGLDLGFVHLVGDTGIFKDLRWGGAIRNMGKAYSFSGTPGVLGRPPAFTPAFGASFSLVNTYPLRLSFSPELSFPTFQDIRLGMGVEFAVADIFFLDFSGLVDLRQLAGWEPAREVPVTFGAALKLKNLSIKGKGFEVNEFKTTLAAAPLQNGIWAMGAGVNIPFGLRDTTPPQIDVGPTDEKYISPNFDGVQDSLDLTLAVTDARFVKGYRFVIQDAAGTAVRTILNKEDRPENRDFKGIMSRIAYVKKGIAVPPAIRWDGKTDAGAVVPDGAYAWFVEAWDDNDNTGRSAVGKVAVDNTPPSVAVSAPYLIFSPNGDGNKDSLALQQSGSSEDKWTGSVRTIAGAEVTSFTWNSAAPSTFSWDGKTREGVTAPDGVYAYSISATDRAGNTVSAQLDNLIVDTEATPAQLAIDLSFFSPNGDGVKDGVTFAITAPATGIEKWSLVIDDAKAAPRRTFSGTLSVPAKVSWDGKDDAGGVLAEGGYTAKLDIRYVNGNNPKAESPVITIDVTPPTAAAKAEYEVFSPNGDGNKDTVSVFNDTSEEVFWTGTAKDSAGKDVRTTVWRGRADAKWAWDGRSDTGTPLADGSYAYTLSTTDRAGNTGSSRSLTVRIDTSETPVRVSTDSEYFSPNADGIKDRVRILPSLRVTTGIDAYTVRVRNAKGDAVRSFTGRTRAPEEISWDGIDDAGKRVSDGQYAVELEVVYANGNKPLVVSNPFFVDTRVPQVDVRAELLLFSPTPDSRLAAIAIRQSSSEEDLWEGEIRDAKGARVKGWFWKGKALDFSWDGKDENGNRAPDGYYVYVVKSQNRAGTSVTKELRGIQIDTRPTPVYLTASSNGFSPNGDGVRDDITFTSLVTLKEGVKSWKLSLAASAGVQKEFAGTSPVPATFTWDGKDKGGFQAAPEGTYTAVLQVEYAKGNLAEAKSAPFVLDVSAPKVDITFEGLPFSPDNDGVNDELTIRLTVDSQVPITGWEIAILDPVQNSFNRFSGRGAPSREIIWNGLSETGELVEAAEDYTLTFSIKDELGNAGTVKKVIPVDVLVIKDGDKYKVKIASITFVADKADFTNVDPEKAEKNSWVVKRLAEIFRKYGQYKIRIEGHANRVNFANKAAWAKEDAELLPLSKSRADAIREALIREGIEAARITTAGVGASQPVVDFADRNNIWKNRRVEFILLR